MATVAAGPVFRLLGAKDLGVKEDYRVAKMPPVNQGQLDGDLAWRQHDGGHEDRTNMSSFLGWANRVLKYHAPARPADTPVMRSDRNTPTSRTRSCWRRRRPAASACISWAIRSRAAGAGRITRTFLAHWQKSFHGWNAGNFGWGADQTQNILWRLQNGELDGVNPKVIVLLAGTNNLPGEKNEVAKVTDVTRGLTAIVDLCRAKAPGATIILMGILRAMIVPVSRRPSTESTPTSPGWPTAKMFVTSTSTPNLPIRTARSSRA